MRKILAVSMMAVIGFCVSALGEPMVETRALWIAAYDVLTPEAIDETVDLTARAGMNAIMPCVFCHGWALWSSELLPMRPGVPDDFDPLAYMVEKAHEKGIEVHPWFAVTYVGGRSGESLGPVLDAHPEFGICGEDGTLNEYDGGTRWADPRNEGFRLFFESLVREVVENYEIDGVHVDYIRSGRNNYCVETAKEFEQRFGHGLEEATTAELFEFTGPAVADLVRRSFQVCREGERKIPLTAAVFTQIDAIKRQGQDPIGWVKDGILDLSFTMNYEMSTLMLQFMEEPFKKAIESSHRGVGLSLYTKMDSKAVPRQADLVVEQIKAARATGTDHLAFFASRYLSDETVEALASGPFSESAEVAIELVEGETSPQ